MKRKQIVSLLLALLLFFSGLPFPVLAEETDADPGTGDDPVDAFFDADEASFDEELLDDDWWKAYVDDDAAEDEPDDTWDQPSENEESDDQETGEDPAWNDDEGQEDSEWDEDENGDDGFLLNAEPDAAEPALSLEEVIQYYGYAYVLTKGETEVYPDPEQAGNPIFVLIEKDSILLVTEYHRETDTVKVWFIGDDVLFSGYVSSRCLKDEILADDEVDAYTDMYWWDWAETEAGELYTFYVTGYATVSAEEYPNEEWVNDSETEDVSEQVESLDYPDSDPNETDESDGYVDDEQPEDEETIEEIPVLRSAMRGMALTAVQSASSLTGSETVRLGKESSNINGILLQNNGSSSTSIARHWVTVNGTEYTAFCIQASKSATSGRDGNMESSTDAGLQWIMINMSDSSDQDYAIKQQAIWIYLGQSYSASDLKAGSRCTLSTDELRARLNSIVASANSASYNSRYELWVAYHKENRSYYQDMIFITSAPTPTPVPTPTPTPTPTATPYVPPTATPYVPPTATPYVPPTATPYVPPTATPYVPPTATPYVPPTATPYVPPTATPYVPPTATPYVPPTATPYVTPTPTPEPTQGWIR
ncbi:MAG: Cys-Gln thioester bond-forming surface protein, partial [Clostridia bacterium]|nr:Cys-Gln thioester bond-forming surface protein [Clostridia bacterium]